MIQAYRFINDLIDGAFAISNAVMDFLSKEFTLGGVEYTVFDICFGLGLGTVLLLKVIKLVNPLS